MEDIFVSSLFVRNHNLAAFEGEQQADSNASLYLIRTKFNKIYKEFTKMNANYLAEGGTPITPELATVSERIIHNCPANVLTHTSISNICIFDFQELRQLVFGTAAIPMRAEWTQTPFLFGTPKEELAYGLRSPRNATRGLLSVVQGYILKHMLFSRRIVRGSAMQE